VDFDGLDEIRRRSDELSRRIRASAQARVRAREAGEPYDVAGLEKLRRERDELNRDYERYFEQRDRDLGV
jgi:hypothetical protein